MNNLHRDSMIESIEREYNRECSLALKEYDDRKKELTETLTAELNEKKKAILNDYLTAELGVYIFLFLMIKNYFKNYCFKYNLNMFLVVESSDQKPPLTRKLRRRQNDPDPVLQEKRRNPPPVSNINYLLNEHEIEQDIKDIQESLASIPSTSASATSIVKTCDILNSSSIKKPSILYFMQHYFIINY